MNVKENSPVLEVHKTKQNHNRKPRQLTTKQKKKIEPSYVPPVVNYTPVPYVYNSLIEVPKVIKHRNHNVRYYNDQRRFFMKWRYIKAGRVKTCTGCGEEKAYSFFDRTCDTKKSKVTRRSYCSKCRKKKNREYYLKNKERHKQANADYYAANTEQSKLTMRKNHVYRTKGRVIAGEFENTLK